VGVSSRAFNIDFFPIPKNEEVVSHPVLYSDKLYQENNVQGRIVVKSPDTGLLFLLVHYFPKMKNPSELWFQTGLITSTKDYRRYIPIHELCKSLSSVVCEILPAAHSLTGCDTTSSFFGIGKKYKSCLKPKLTCVFHFWKIMY
jgi:hypothetical protein